MKNTVTDFFASLAFLYPTIAEEWHPTKNAELTPTSVSPRSGKKVWWLCKRCGYEHPMLISNRTKRGGGCPCCSGKLLVRGRNDFATVHPELVKYWSEKNGKAPDMIKHSESHEQVLWGTDGGGEFSATPSRYVRLSYKEREGAGERAVRHQMLFLEFHKEYDSFLSTAWDEKLNGFPYADIQNQQKKYIFRCKKCKCKVKLTVKGARKNGTLCNSCYSKEVELKRSLKKAEKAINKAKNRSFGQTAIAFYLSMLPELEVKEELKVTDSRRYSVDVAVTDKRSGALYAIEHDSERYHSTEERKAQDTEKESILKELGYRVIRVIERKGRCDGDIERNNVFVYSENSRRGLGCVINRLISEMFDLTLDIDVVRDTMKILRMKNYQGFGGKWDNTNLFRLLFSEWDKEANEGYSLCDFSFGASYHASWKCSRCGSNYYATVSNRYKGRGCPWCNKPKRHVERSKSFAALYPEKAKSYSGENEISPFDITAGSGKKVKWLCDICGYEWHAQLNVVVRSKYNGCPKCGKEKGRRSKFKPVVMLDENGVQVGSFSSLDEAGAAGFKKVSLAIREGKKYKGYRWCYAECDNS